ncbi:hypothetical protein [Pseudolactococcus raffinolactis]|uniref:hypothetical protein n=1 Tax=Pseudolactococcus raffinolactis TaxID=1366 RepID=UPI000BE03E6E|nr:hypothetical protein [Lactococcus raffinolactis]PCS09484.1 hypothetical protein RU88_GL001467 [Lactococcus raffinolactis]
MSQFKQEYDGFKSTVYTKGQTDTKVSTVQQSVDNFKTTVSSTYSSKAETDNKVTAVQANVDKLGTNIAYAWSQDGKDRFTRVKPNENIITQSPSGVSLTSTTTNNTDFFSAFKISQNYQTLSNWTTLNEVFTLGFSWESSTDLPDGASIGMFFAKAPWTFGFDSTNNVSGKKGSVSKTGNNGGNLYNSIQTAMTIRLTNIPVGTIITITKVFIIAGSGKSFVLSSQDDYDNAVPRYIGRSLKDSNSPTDYKWEPNPERKPWTAYANSADGTDGFTTVYPNLNLLVNSSAKTKDGFFKNFDKVENDYGEVTIKGTNTWVSRSMWDGFSIQPRDYKPNDKYTMSMDVMFTSWNLPAGTTIGEFWIGQRYSTSTDGSINSWKQICYIDLPKDPSKMLNQWIRITQTSTIPPYADPSVNTEARFMTRFIGASEGSFTVRVRKPKQELANTMNIPTPWTPAPSEDPLGAIPKYVGTAALPYEDPYKYEWRLSSDWNQVKTFTEFEQTDKEIGLKADQTTVNTITGRVSTAEGAITTMAGQIKLKANQTDVDTTNGKVSSLESSFTVQSGKITALNTKADGHTTQIGTLESSYNGLTSTISKIQTDVGGKAGKTELSQLSQDLSGFKTTVSNTYLSKSDASGTYADKVSVASQITQSATAVTSNVQSWTNNKLITYSTTQQTATSITNAVASKADKSQITQLSDQITSIVTDVSAIQVGGQNLLLGTATAKTSTITQTNSFTATDQYNFSVSKFSAFNFEVDDYITLSFDWETTSTTGTTRPEINSTPYGFGTVISAKGTNGTTSITKTITASEQRGHIEIVFKVSSTVKVSEASKLRLRFDNHQLNSTFTIKNAKLEKGNKATDWCIAPQEVASQSQITQLSDNINLRVSKGDVVSQINVEAGRTLIDTKQLLLNADTVKFTGSAFIPNSVIQNLSADKITAGTINAANVNVINLNAKSLTAGTISGNNLSLNLDTGAVQFTKGYIAGNNSKIRFDLDKNYFQSLDGNNNGFIVSDGTFTFYQSFFGATGKKSAYY